MVSKTPSTTIHTERLRRKGASHILSQHPTRLAQDTGSYKGSRRTKKSIKKKILLSFLVILFGVFIYGLTLLWSFLRATSSSIQFNFWHDPIKQTEDRINIVLLGIGGGTHDGSLLTDSIIVASYSTKTNKVMLISVPRDLWLTDLNGKINTAYELGIESKNGGDGLKFAEEKIGEVVGLSIHYGMRIDFSGFAKAIDAVGGVDVNVPTTFDDYEYPVEGREDDFCGYSQKDVVLTDPIIAQLGLTPPPVSSESATPSAGTVKAGDTRLLWINGKGELSPNGPNYSCRYEHVHFVMGPTHMDGATALEFVRSRHGNHGEGSDFARSRRQQLVIQAFRDKALSLGTWSNPQKAIDLMNALGKSIETDIPAERLPDFYGFAKKEDQVMSIVLGDLENGQSVLINPPVSTYGAWVLIPPSNDFTLIHSLISDDLKKQATASAKVSK